MINCVIGQLIQLGVVWCDVCVVHLAGARPLDANCVHLCHCWTTFCCCCWNGSFPLGWMNPLPFSFTFSGFKFSVGTWAPQLRSSCPRCCCCTVSRTYSEDNISLSFSFGTCVLVVHKHWNRFPVSYFTALAISRQSGQEAATTKTNHVYALTHSLCPPF